MRDDKDKDREKRATEASAPVAGYKTESKPGAEPRANTSKLSRHVTRVLPSAIALRNEYRKLCSDPKCGKRGAISALAKKYKTSQSAVMKALKRKISPV
jgi:hypothetical protein